LNHVVVAGLYSDDFLGIGKKSKKKAGQEDDGSFHGFKWILLIGRFKNNRNF